MRLVTARTGSRSLRRAIATNTDGDPLPDTLDAEVPAPGAAFVYLVTGNNVNGEGPLGGLGASPTRIHDATCP